MANPPLFSNPDALLEAPTDKDLFGFDKEIKRVGQRIEQFVKAKRNSIVAYLGPFGSGKSTVLKNIEDSNDKYEWVTFELWRYSNRQEIWDGFVTKVSSQLNKTSETSVIDKIEGHSWSAKKTKTLAAIVALSFIVVFVVSLLAWSILKGDGSAQLFLRAFLKYAMPTYVSLVALLGVGSILLRTKFLREDRPIKRVFELEDLLSQSLKTKLDKPLIIVAEDVDRSAPEGFVFLETLNFYLDSNLDLKYPIIVIAPQTRLAFDAIKNEGLAGFDRSLKIYDDTIYSEITVPKDGISKFYDSLKVHSSYRESLVDATNRLVSGYRDYISIRMLKHALREVSSFIEVNKGADPVIALALILARYVPMTDMGGNIKPALQQLASGNAFDSEKVNAFYRAMLAGIGKSTTTINSYRVSFKDLEGQEIALEEFQHPNKSYEGRIDIDTKYRALIDGVM